MTTRQLAEDLDLWQRVENGIATRCCTESGQRLLRQIGAIPVQPSRATTRLGSYVFRGMQAVCIRLQFAQDQEILRLTLLHEIAHACDHLQATGLRRRLAHGESWQQWAQALGIDPVAGGACHAVSTLHQRRKKLVAVCSKCGAEIYRVRRLNRRYQYVHPACGGRLEPVVLKD